MVTLPPIGTCGGAGRVITGLGTSNEFWEVVATPLTVTSSGPVAAEEGTLTTICVSLQLVTEPATPLNVTVFAPWVEVKPVPAIVTGVPATPPAGVYELIN